MFPGLVFLFSAHTEESRRRTSVRRQDRRCGPADERYHPVMVYLNQLERLFSAWRGGLPTKNLVRPASLVWYPGTPNWLIDAKISPDRQIRDSQPLRTLLPWNITATVRPPNWYPPRHRFFSVAAPIYALKRWNVSRAFEEGCLSNLRFVKIVKLGGYRFCRELRSRLEWKLNSVEQANFRGI